MDDKDYEGRAAKVESVRLATKINSINRGDERQGGVSRQISAVPDLCCIDPEVG